MQNIYVISGPCGCGKSTFADAFAGHLIATEQKWQVYVIHGDDFHKGFIETSKRLGPSLPGFLYWPDILAFNWECILNVADHALKKGLDVIIDYVVEDELPLLIQLASKHQAKLFYIVLTAPNDTLIERLRKRGSEDLIERSLFLKEKLDHAADNQGHLLNNGSSSISQVISEMRIDDYVVNYLP